MNAHELGKILMEGEDIPVVISSSERLNKAVNVEDVSLYQNIDSPFEYCLLLSSDEDKPIGSEIELPD